MDDHTGIGRPWHSLRRDYGNKRSCARSFRRYHRRCVRCLGAAASEPNIGDVVIGRGAGKGDCRALRCGAGKASQACNTAGGNAQPKVAINTAPGR